MVDGERIAADDTAEKLGLEVCGHGSTIWAQLDGSFFSRTLDFDPGYS